MRSLPSLHTVCVYWQSSHIYTCRWGFAAFNHCTMNSEVGWLYRVAGLECIFFCQKNEKCNHLPGPNHIAQYVNTELHFVKWQTMIDSTIIAKCGNPDHGAVFWFAWHIYTQHAILFVGELHPECLAWGGNKSLPYCSCLLLASTL